MNTTQKQFNKRNPNSKPSRESSTLGQKGMRSYVRNLSNGYEPNEALKRASMENRKRNASDNQQQKFSKMPKKDNDDSDEVMDDGPVESDSSKQYQYCPKFSDTSIRMVLAAEEFPLKLLTVEEMDTLEDMLVERLSDNYETKLQFDNMYIREGYLLFDCSTQASVDWLQSVLPSLKDWSGPQLKLFNHTHLLKPNQVIILFPQYKEADLPQVLKTIEAQNENIDTNLWHVSGQSEVEAGLLLWLVVDTKTAEHFFRITNRLFFRFEKIQVYGLRYKDKRRAIKISLKETDIKAGVALELVQMDFEDMTTQDELVHSE